MSAPRFSRIRIACFGDSLTEGYCKRGSLFYPYSQYLKAHVEDIVAEHVHIESFGVSGEETKQMLERLPRLFVSDPNTMAEKAWDIVVVLGGTNDIGYNRDPQYIVQNLNSMGRRIKDSGATPFFMSVPSLGKRLSDFLDSTLPSQMELNRKIQEMCGRHGFVFVDLNKDTLDSDGQTLKDHLVDLDGLHLSLEGYKEMARIVGVSIVKWAEFSANDSHQQDQSATFETGAKAQGSLSEGECSACLGPPKTEDH